jgi:RimJ/RimL family protein N-acetyltransferase
MRIALMIEGQEDVTWEDWVALAETCEASGVEALFRSDHYLSVGGHPERGALDAWGTVNALAARTTTLRLGTIDVFLDPALHGRGLGTEAVRRLTDLLFDERGHHRITIDPAVTNAQAIKAYTKVGFRPVGTLRQYERDTGGDGWHDGLLMELLAIDRRR